MPDLPSTKRRMAKAMIEQSSVFYLRGYELPGGAPTAVYLPRTLLDELNWKPGQALRARAAWKYPKGKGRGIVVLEVD